jgi:hypothetical protein
MEENKIFFDESIFVHFGKILLQKAEEIYREGLKAEDKLEKIYRDFSRLNTEYDLIDSNLNFYSKSLNGSCPGPEEVKTYWLEFLMKKFQTKEFKYLKPEDCIIGIANDTYSFNQYKKHDFFNDRFIMTYPADNNYGLVLVVPFGLNKLVIDFAIEIIEKLTTSKVAGISLWYYRNDISISAMEYEIQISLDKNTGDSYPFISKNEFKSINFLNFNEWYLEVPKFKHHIEIINKEENNND